MDPSSLWDWGCGPLIFVGLGLAPLSPGGGSDSTVPASLHLTEGSAYPLQLGPGSGKRGEEMPFVAQEQPFWHSYFPLSLLILQKFLISSVALPG